MIKLVVKNLKKNKKKNTLIIFFIQSNTVLISYGMFNFSQVPCCEKSSFLVVSLFLLSGTIPKYFFTPQNSYLNVRSRTIKSVICFCMEELPGKKSLAHLSVWKKYPKHEKENKLKMNLINVATIDWLQPIAEYLLEFVFIRFAYFVNMSAYGITWTCFIKKKLLDHFVFLSWTDIRRKYATEKGCT